MCVGVVRDKPLSGPNSLLHSVSKKNFPFCHCPSAASWVIGSKNYTGQKVGIFPTDTANFRHMVLRISILPLNFPQNGGLQPQILHFSTNIFGQENLSNISDRGNYLPVLSFATYPRFRCHCCLYRIVSENKFLHT